jgi:hypothetical protein
MLNTSMILDFVSSCVAFGELECARAFNVKEIKVLCFEMN